MPSGEERSPGEGRVVGRYLLCDPIASGGMATVHIGRLLGPVGFSRTVAIKRLHPHFARDPEFVAMFLDEARLAGRIRHPNVVSTLDVVVLQGELFVVMDYVHGEALSRLSRAAGPMPVSITASIVAGLLYGLHAAHEARNDDGSPLHIVHRDVSPQNVLVGVDGVARVVDFGVAKAVGRSQTTREGALKGKLSYMSPEQISGEAVDRRTDIYAASVVLWEMLVGRRLFQAESEVRVLQQVLEAKIDPPSKHAAVPRELDALVMKGLARRAEDRFATASEMAEAVQRIAFATPGQVSAWVQATGGQLIEQRARKVAEIESSQTTLPREAHADDEDTTIALSGPPLGPPIVAALTHDSVAAVPVSAPAPVDSQVSGLNVSSSAGRRPAWYSRLSVIAAGSFGVVFVVGGIVLAFIVHSREPAVDATHAPPSVESVSPLAADPTASPGAMATIAPVASTSATAASPAIAPTAKPPAQTVTRPRTSCNPPYTVKDGIRTPKRECL